MSECDECGGEGILIKERGREKHFKCAECGTFFIEVEDKAVEITAVLSHQEESERRRISVPGDAELAVGDDMLLDDVICRITKVEVGVRSVPRAMPRDVECVWLIDRSYVRLRLAIRTGKGKTQSILMEARPETEFTVGQVLEFEKADLRITGIRADGRTLRRGTALADEITTIYCSTVR
ncbi:MAG: HVO_0476 family zinc finger protein [Candidatus Undinarchaeales archaeon]|nr:HVO_0476 family zinc finger protein [Candidatus Undinarchaeales archaeon]